MKKRSFLWLTIIGMVISACVSTPIDDTIIPTVLSQTPVKVTFNAQQVDEEGTKTVRNSDKTVSWLPAEEIYIFCGTDKGKFTSTNTEKAATVSFTGELNEATVNSIKAGTNAPIWALYPYDENAVFDGSSVTTTLPNFQTGVIGTSISGTFADDLFITLAKSDNFNLYFYNVCSGFKFSVPKEGITSITIQGNNNEDIAGKVKLSFGGDGKPQIVEVVDGQKTITLVPESGSSFQKGKYYYFVTLPTPFTLGFTVTFNTPSETGAFVHNSNVSFPRSSFVTKSFGNEDVTFEAKEGNINIPDANFKAYCVESFDGNNDDGIKDGEISYAEALTASTINVRNKSINTLSGIEFFTNITTLFCDQNNLVELDVSNNINLQRLGCGGNFLSGLDVSMNKKLQRLQCDANDLKELNVSNNTQLTLLTCSFNKLTTLDVSKNTSLQTLTCGGMDGETPFSGLDLSNNTKLRQIKLHDFSFPEMDVSIFEDLKELICPNLNLGTLDISHNSNLTHLECHQNGLTTLDVSNNTLLQALSCGDNLLSSLNTSNNTALTRLEIDNNSLSSIDVSNNTLLQRLTCDNNPLSSLDVSNNTSLTYLHCTSIPNLVIWIQSGQNTSGFHYDNTATIYEK